MHYLNEYREGDGMQLARDSVHIGCLQQLEVVHHQYQGANGHQHAVDAHGHEGEEEEEKVAQVARANTVVRPDTVVVKSMDASVAKPWNSKQRSEKSASSFSFVFQNRTEKNAYFNEQYKRRYKLLV